MKISTIILSHSSFSKNNITELKNLSSTHVIIDSNDQDIIAKCNKFIKNSNNDILITSAKVSSENISELKKILNISERHGAVSPRGSNFGLNSFPINQKIAENDDSYKKLHSEVNGIIAEYYITPYLSPSCILISGRLLKRFYLFDEKIKSIDDAIADWCISIGKLGYSSIVANRLFIENFRLPKYELSFDKKVPFYNKLVDKYLSEEISPIEKFIMLLNKKNNKPKILLSLFQLAPVHNGTAEHALTMIEKLIKNFSDKYDFHILINKENSHFFQLEKKYNNIIYPENLSDIYLIGITFIQIFDSRLFSILNSHCAKIIQTVLDIISYRSTSISYYTDTSIMKKSIEYSDSIITISKTVKNDIISAFPELKNNIINKIKPILISTTEKNIIENNNYKSKLAFENFILIFGNHYDHKALNIIYPLLKDISYNFIIVGLNTGKEIKNIQSFTSGGLSDDFINYLYKNCDALLFPSEYEGYGLPIVNALSFGKSVIVADTEINHELADYFYEFRSKFIFYNLSSELKSIIEGCKFTTGKVIKNIRRNYDDVAKETEVILSKLVKRKTDYKNIIERNKVLIYQPENKKTFYQKIKYYLKVNHPNISLFLRKIKSIF